MRVQKFTTIKFPILKLLGDPKPKEVIQVSVPQMEIHNTVVYNAVTHFFDEIKNKNYPIVKDLWNSFDTKSAYSCLLTVAASKDLNILDMLVQLPLPACQNRLRIDIPYKHLHQLDISILPKLFISVLFNESFIKQKCIEEYLEHNTDLQQFKNIDEFKKLFSTEYSNNLFEEKNIRDIIYRTFNIFEFIEKYNCVLTENELKHIAEYINSNPTCVSKGNTHYNRVDSSEFLESVSALFPSKRIENVKNNTSKTIYFATFFNKYHKEILPLIQDSLFKIVSNVYCNDLVAFDMISKCIDLNMIDDEGNTLLMNIIKKSKCIKHLLKYNIDVSLTNYKEQNALLIALLTSSLNQDNNVHNLIQYVKSNCIDQFRNIINQQDIEGKFPLMVASGSNILESLLNIEEMDINQTNFMGESVLLYLVQNINSRNNKSHCELLLKNPRLDINVTDLEGNTILFNLIKQKDITFIKNLLDNTKIDINVQNNVGNNVLHYLLSNKVVPQIKTIDTYEGGYAAYPACYEKSSLLDINDNKEDKTFDLCRLFIDYGIDINAPNEDNNTIFKMAIDNNDMKLINYIYKSKHFDINGKVHDGQSYIVYLLNNAIGVKTKSTKCSGRLLSPSLKLLKNIPSYDFRKEYTVNRMEEFDYVESPQNSTNYFSASEENVENTTIKSVNFLNQFMKLLKTPGVKINDDEYPIIHIAAGYSASNILSSILKHPDVNVNLLNNLGQTPLDVAVQNKCIYNQKILKSKGALLSVELNNQKLEEESNTSESSDCVNLSVSIE